MYAVNSSHGVTDRQSPRKGLSGYDRRNSNERTKPCLFWGVWVAGRDILRDGAGNKNGRE